MDKDDPTYQLGRKVRGEMFGAGAVTRLDEADDFNREIQEFVTRNAFGEIWGRPGLPRKVRSMITIAILFGASRPVEFRRHIKAGIANGLTKDEIKEVLLHATLYFGIPSASDGFANAEEALKEIGAY